MTETSGNLALKKESASKLALPAIRTRFSSTGSACCIVVLRQERRFDAINLHLYHYAGNNPVRYTDPDGEQTYNYSIIRNIVTKEYIVKNGRIITKYISTTVVNNYYSTNKDLLIDVYYDQITKNAMGKYGANVQITNLQEVDDASLSSDVSGKLQKNNIIVTELSPQTNNQEVITSTLIKNEKGEIEIQ